MTTDLRAYSLRKEAEGHARQKVPLEMMSQAAVLDEALSIMAANLARALTELDALKTSAAPPQTIHTESE